MDNEELERFDIVVHTHLDRMMQLEVGKLTHSKAFRNVCLGAVAILIIYNVANLVVTGKDALFLLLWCIGPVCVLSFAAKGGYWPITLIRGHRQWIRNNKRWPEYLVCFNSDEEVTYSLLAQKRYKHAYTELTAIKESTNLLVLVCSTTVIVVDKNAFVRGSYDDLKQLLQSKGLPLKNR